MRSRDVFDLLAAPGPFSGYAERVMLYGRFVFPEAGGHRERWRVTEIAPDSFRWLGAVSKDGGVTWELVQELRARRRT